MRYRTSRRSVWPRSRTGVSLFLVVLIAVSGPFKLKAQDVSAHRELDFANRLIRDRRYDLAADEYEKVLAKAPGAAVAADARFGLATARWFLGQHQEARRDFELFLKQAPSHANAATAWFRVGETAYMLGDLDAARTALETYTSKYPEHRYLDTAWTYLGEVRFRRGDLDAARKAYEQVITRFPQSRLIDRARYGEGRTLAARQDYAGALALFEAVLKGKNPDWTDRARFQVGLAQLAAGKPNEAVAAFEALEVDAPHSALVSEARLRRAEALSKLGRDGEAITLLRPLAAGETGMASQAAYALAGCLLKQNHSAEALAACDEALKRFPETPMRPLLLFQGAEALAASGRPDEARKRFEELVSAHPKDEWADDALLRAAELAQKAGDTDAARALAVKLAAQYPKSVRRPHARLIEAQAAIAAKDAKAAITLLEPLLADAELDAALAQAVRLALGVAYNDAGQPEKAREVLKDQANAPAANTPAPKLAAEAQYVLGIGHFDAKRYAESAAALDAYLAAKPTGNVAADALGYLAVARQKLGQDNASQHALERLAADFPKSKILFQTRLALGEAALDAGVFERAMPLLGAAVESAPEPALKARALWGLGWSQLESKEPAKAVASFTALLGAAPKDPLAPEATLALARAAEESNDNDAALEAYRRAAEKYPKIERVTAAAQLGRARLLGRLGHHEEAAAVFEAYLKAHPTTPERGEPTDAVLAEFGWSLLDADKQAESAAVFRRLLDEHPTSPHAAEARVALAEAAHEAHQLDEAQKLLEAVVAAKPPATPELMQSALFRLGLIHFDRRDWQEATSRFQRLIREFPTGPFFAKAQFWAAETALQSGDAKTAEPAFDALVKGPKPPGADDWMPTARLRHIESLVALERWADALKEADAFKADSPGFPALHELEYARGRALQGLGRFEEARAAHQAVIDAHRADDFAARAQLMRGETFFHQRKYTDALKEYLRVVYDDTAAAPLKAAALLEGGKTYEHLERWPEAADLYEQIVTRYGGDPLAKAAADRLKAVRSKLPGS